MALEHSTALAISAGPSLVAPLVGSSNIASEDLVSYEAGYRAQLTDAISIDAATFYNVYHNLILLVAGTPRAGRVPGKTIFPVAFENRMRGNGYGAEVGADWKLTDWWKVRGAYTFLELQLRPDPSLPAASQTTARAQGEQSPDNEVYVQSSWNLPHNVEFDLIARYVDALRGFNPTHAAGVDDAVPAYITLDARLGWRPRENLELAVVGQNLLDSHHPEASGGSAVEIRRSVYGVVTYRW